MLLLGRHLFIWPWCLGLSLRGAQSGLPRIRTQDQALSRWYQEGFLNDLKVLRSNPGDATLGAAQAQA